jgi:tetratricopeptide (TPR) repeat protein
MHRLALLALAAGIAASAQPPSAVFDGAVAAFSRGDYAAAESGFQKVLGASPNDVAALQNLGLVYARTDRLDKACAIYRRALTLSPGNSSVLLNLGLAHLKQKSYAEALAVFQELVRGAPESRPARDIHLLYPLCAGYLSQIQSDGGRRTMTVFLASLPPAAASLVRCKLHYASERLEEAAAECRETLATDPTFPGAHLEMAKVLVAQRSPDAAQELTAAIREGPSAPEALYDLGVALAQEGRTEEGLGYLESAKRVDPGFWGSYFQLGKIRLGLHQADQAVPLLQKAADLNPGDFAVFYELGRALMATGKIEEGRRAMEHVRELQARELERDAQALRKR